MATGENDFRGSEVTVRLQWVRGRVGGEEVEIGT